MTRPMLLSLTLAAALSTAAGGDALSQVDGRDFLVWQKGFGGSSSKEPKALAGKAPKPRKAWPSKIRLPSLVKKRR